MANIKLNGQSNINNVTCFSYAPTILEVSSSTSGSYTIYTISVNSFGPYSNNQWIKVNDVVINRVDKFNEAKGYHFYMSGVTTTASKKLMVNSLTEALRRIPEVMAGYEVYMPSSGGEKQLMINLKSITYGNNTPLEITTNMSGISISKMNGSASTEFKEGNLKIDVNRLYPAVKYNSSTTYSGTYYTTLSKHTSNDTKVKFDLGSVFASMTPEGEVAQFGINIYQVSESGLTEIGSYNNIYNVNGYLINQGGEFIPPFSNSKIALNVNRGTNRNFINNTILYVYEPSIPLSIYASSGVNTITCSIKYIDSGNATISTSSQTLSLSNALTHCTISLSSDYLLKSKYVDIELGGSLGTLRFNVIKPIRATDECQRVYWYNSWGGVSFFDFTGDRSEERKVKTTTYQDSVLDYYDNNINERDYIYDKQNDISVKLTTHNIHKDGQWYLFDLQQSRTAWTYVNGEKYRIIVEDLTINSTSVTDIYTATVEYKYSMGVNI